MCLNSDNNIFKGTFKQLLAAIIATTAVISDGMQYGWSAPVIPILLSETSHVVTTKHQAEMLETLYIIGAISGVPITIYLVDKFGRKNSIIFAAFTTLLAWIAIAVASRIEILLAARFFTGLASDTAFVAAPMYLAEIADQKIRGFLSSIIYIMMLIGILLIYSIAPFVPFYVPSVIGGSLNLITILVFPFMPDSPYHLLMKGKDEKARRHLERLRRNEDVNSAFKEIYEGVEKQRSEKKRPLDLVVVPSNRKAFLIMTVLNAAQHFSSISVIIMNLHIILEAAGSIYIESTSAAIIFSAIMLIAASAASFMIDAYGRKVLLILSSLLTGLCLLAIAIFFTLKNSGYDVDGISWIPIASVMVYAAVFKFGLGLVPIVLTGELFAPNIKAVGMTLSDVMYVVFALFSLEIYQRMSDAVGLDAPFYVFASSCIVTAIFTAYYIPETKGKTLEQIQSLLKGEAVTEESRDYKYSSVPELAQ